MDLPRTARLAAVLAGLAGPPGCIVTTGVQETPAIAPPTPANRPSDFAKYITRPGERVAVHEPAGPKPVEAVVAKPPTPAARPAANSTPPEVAPAVRTTATDPPPRELPPFTPPPAPPDPALVAAARAVVAGRADEAERHLQGFDRPQREVLLKLLACLATTARTNLATADPLEVGLLAAQLDAAATALGGKPPLAVQKAVFVHRVRQFGDYDPVPDGHPFQKAELVRLVVEVRNAPFDPTPHPDGGDGYGTKLDCVYRMRDAAGRVVEQWDESRQRMAPEVHTEVLDVRRSPVRDFLVKIDFTMPPRPGGYVITVDVRDPATGRAVRKDVEFRVGP